MQSTSLPAETRAVLNAAYRIGAALGRKFESTDLTIELRQAARHYAATYNGDFPYMLEMHNQVIAGTGAFLSDGQSKAVLNCLMADAKRRLADKPKTAPAVVAAPAHMFLTIVPDGRYRVTQADGTDIALKITEAGKDSKLAGSRVISTRINGDEWMGVAHVGKDGALRLWRSLNGALRPRVRDAINVLDAATDQDGWLVAGLAFARQGSECFICGRDLDTPESLTAGYGPVCAEKNGLPWGLKASPPSAAPAVEPTPNFDGLTELAEKAADRIIALKEETADERYARYVERSNRIAAQAKAEGRPRTYDEIFGVENY